MNDILSLSHSKWRCQYHIVFAPKYRRKEVYGKIKKRRGRNTTEAVRTETCGDNGSKCVFRPYTHVGMYTTELKCSTVHGIFEREEQSDELRQACQLEV